MLVKVKGLLLFLCLLFGTAYVAVGGTGAAFIAFLLLLLQDLTVLLLGIVVLPGLQVQLAQFVGNLHPRLFI